MGNVTKNKKKETIIVRGEYITLGQLLKAVRVVGEGGMAKAYLSTHQVLVNGEVDSRRGRKLRPGDVVELEEGIYSIEGKCD